MDSLKAHGPLSGKRVVVTRPRPQASTLSDRLAIEGAFPIVLPTVAIEPIEPNRALEVALEELEEFDWIIFTSVNGVDIFVNQFDKQRAAVRMNATRVAAIGPVTARALASYGVRTDVVPMRFVAEEIVTGLGNVRHQRILLPRAARARRRLADVLRERGARVTEVALYRTVVPPVDGNALTMIIDGVDAVTFTSSSTVENFMTILADSASRVFQRAVVACIGPITAQTARALGLHVDIVADRYTAEGLVDALLEYFEKKSRGEGQERWN